MDKQHVSTKKFKLEMQATFEEYVKFGVDEFGKLVEHPALSDVIFIFELLRTETFALHDYGKFNHLSISAPNKKMNNF